MERVRSCWYALYRPCHLGVSSFEGVLYAGENSTVYVNCVNGKLC
jgi:hypothetical protein